MKPMPSVQSYRISDALRCTILNAPRGPNLACPRPATGAGRPVLPSAGLWRGAVMQPRDRLALARWQGTQLAGLVSARSRSGIRAWEIDSLYLSPGVLPAASPRTTSFTDGVGHHTVDHIDSTGSCAESLALLEELFQAAGERSAERVFLRLGSTCPSVSLARRAGFIACYNEVLLESPQPASGNGALNLSEAGQVIEGLRRRLPADNYGLFQLFCASTPVRVRQSVGITFDQWLDARDTAPGRSPSRRQQEWVVECTGRIAGWARVTGRGTFTETEVMAHPDRPDLLFNLVDFVLDRAPRSRWLVPDYREPVACRLQDRGFRRVKDYTLMVKMVAVPAPSYGMAAVEA